MHPKPTLVAHADWGSAAPKRALVVAVLSQEGRYQVSIPRQVNKPERLLADLALEAGPGGSVFAGFDFPIGLPLHYAEKVGVKDFRDFLSGLGQGEWQDFYRVAAIPEEISLRRPFYPNRAGASKQWHLLQALSATTLDDLRRQCERAGTDEAGATHRAACPLFWTLGGQQVGKAAIHGWSHMIGPALNDPSVTARLWPFDGDMDNLIQPGGILIAETYPAEFYHHLGVKFSTHRAGTKSGKRVQSERAANAIRLLDWAEYNRVEVDPDLERMLVEGFGRHPYGDDMFDATVGLFGMLNVILGNQPCRIPEDEHVRRIEGWILGKARL